MNIYLPIAGNAVNIFVIFGLGGIVGLLSGIFGVGGGFLMTPLLIMMGIPPTVAAASDSNQIVGHQLQQPWLIFVWAMLTLKWEQSCS